MTNEDKNNSHTTPFHQPEPFVPPPNGKGKEEDTLLRTVMTGIGLSTLGLSLLSGAMIAVAILAEKFIALKDPIDRSTLIYKVVPIAITYIIGWVISLISIRAKGNLVLPYFINIYAWLTMTAISALYIAIIIKLYEQKHTSVSFNKYMIMMAIGMIAFIGLHLLLKNHSLILFSIPLLVINLFHLLTILYHYVYSLDVNYEFLWSDLLFFFEMVTISMLMLLHLGVLSGARNTIDRLFERNDNGNGNTKPQNQS